MRIKNERCTNRVDYNRVINKSNVKPAAISVADLVDVIVVALEVETDSVTRTQTQKHIMIVSNSCIKYTQ